MKFGVGEKDLVAAFYYRGCVITLVRLGIYIVLLHWPIIILVLVAKVCLYAVA